MKQRVGAALKPRVGAAFSYQIESYRKHRVIVIEDLYNPAVPTMSVTNDIENVLEYIEKIEKINSEECLVIYRDTEGNWDGYGNKRFVPLRKKDPESAIQRWYELAYPEPEHNNESDGNE